MLAAIALGAEGVQIGSRFAVSVESSAHQNFKNQVLEAKDGDTMLTLKQLAPVRMIKNKLYEKIQDAQQKGSSADELKQILGKGRSKLGIFEGNIDEGELEIGQVSAMINSVQPVSEIMQEIISEFNEINRNLCPVKF